MSHPRTSPVAAIAGTARTGEAHGMPVAVLAETDRAKLDAVALADFSHLPRCGLKGPAAADWLSAQGLPVPSAPNTWTTLPGGGLIARLGRTEFFLEDGMEGNAVAFTKSALGAGAAGAYPVIRQDAGLALLGPRCNELLVQACNVNFEAAGREEAVMTQMVGVSVLAVRQDRGTLRCHRLWCDPTFAPYLWETLAQIAVELDGGIVGTEGLPQ